MDIPFSWSACSTRVVEEGQQVSLLFGRIWVKHGWQSSLITYVGCFVFLFNLWFLVGRFSEWRSMMKLVSFTLLLFLFPFRKDVKLIMLFHYLKPVGYNFLFGTREKSRSFTYKTYYPSVENIELHKGNKHFIHLV